MYFNHILNIQLSKNSLCSLTVYLFSSFFLPWKNYLGLLSMYSPSLMSDLRDLKGSWKPRILFEIREHAHLNRLLPFSKFDLSYFRDTTNFCSHLNQDQQEFVPEFSCISIHPTVPWNCHPGVILHLLDEIHLNRYQMTVLKQIWVDCEINLNICHSEHRE